MGAPEHTGELFSGVEMIRTQDLTRRFEQFTAVDKLNLEVSEGEIFGFLGPNGAGKTTTIRMLCGLIGPTSGKAWIAGYEVGNEKESEKVRRSVGLLTESPGMYELLSAWENMLFYARLYELPAAEAKKRVEEILEWLDLWQWRKEPVGGFSKGMKQKLAIGRTLLHRPQVLFFDEPTASLDAEAARTVREAIVTLKNTRRTIFLSTHNLDEAERLCDRIAIFKQRLLQLDTPLNLRRRFGVQGRQIIVRLQSPAPSNLLEKVRSLPFVSFADWQETNQEKAEAALQMAVADPESQNPALIRCLVQNGAEIRFVEERTSSLEDVYLDMIR
jgi:ABC-2 type transport system ATP-binding protein